MACTAVVPAALAQTEATHSDRVVVLLGPDASEGTGEVLLRVQGELVADGFRVERIGNQPPDAREEVVRDRCAGFQGSIAAGLFVDERAGDVEMIFCETTSRREAVRRAHTTGLSARDPPVVVARHAVDLLRGNLLDFAMEALRVAARPAPEVNVPPAPPARQPEPNRAAVRAAIEAGAGVLAGFGGLDASIAPLVRLRVGLTPWLQLRLTGAGLGTTPTVANPRGSATVGQTLGMADAAWTFAPSTWLRPLVVLGAGAYAADVNGAARAPYTSATSGGIAFAIDGGVGVAPWLTPSLNVALEVHVICALPAMAVRFVDTDAAQLGLPMVLVTLSFAEWI